MLHLITPELIAALIGISIAAVITVFRIRTETR